MEASNVVYKSNLHIIEGENISEDKEFLNSIRDPFALVKLNNSIDRREVIYRLLPIQQEEYDKASLHCSYAQKDDYPFGTILENNEEKVMCKCINTSCLLFSSCRPDFKEEELKILEENDKWYEKSSLTPRMLIEPVREQSVVQKSDISEVDKIFSDNSTADTSSRNIDGKDIKSEEVKSNINSLDKIQVKTLNLGNEDKSLGNITSINPVKALDKNNSFNQGVNNILNIESTFKNREIKKIVNDLKVVQDNNFDKFKEVDQNLVIKHNQSSRILINAGPGTGKTWTLIERIIFLVNQAKVDPEEIMILCFSRSAVEVIKDRLKTEANKGRIGLIFNLIDIRTFDSFATHLLAWISEEEPELLKDEFELHNLSYDQRIKEACKCIENNKELLSQCKHLIVDEIQDLVYVRAELVISVIEALDKYSGFTLLGDSCQSIYDYQVEGNDMDSYEFYKYFFSNHPDILYYSFSRNYRQVSRLEEISDQYRNAILSENSEEIHNSMNTVSQRIDVLNAINLKNVTKEELINIIGDRQTGILTRTNGLALKISTWFSNLDISHTILHRTSQYELNKWIADVFYNYSDDTVDLDRFVQVIQNYNPKVEYKSMNMLWDALMDSINKSGSKKKVSVILKGIVDKGKHSLLFKCNSSEQIVISNIHKSKGKEFNNVILVNQMFSNDTEKDIQEHKVNYVGITRAKEYLFKTAVEKEFIYTIKKAESRCYQKGFAPRGKVRPLSHIEFGLSNDINQKSFAYNKDIQELIQKDTLVGRRVLLVKNKELSKKSLVIYDIWLEECNEPCIIGQTSYGFYNGLEKILRKIYKINRRNEVYTRLFPERFSDIYVSDVITVIGKMDNKLIGAKKYDDMMIWYGLSLNGFAIRERDVY